MSTFQKYINYLIEDLEVAKNNLPSPSYQVSVYPEKPEAIVEWENAPYQTLEELFNIPPQAFPPVKRLNKEQMVRINKSIVDLWQTYNLIPDLPVDLPSFKKYELLTSHWNRKVQYLTQGEYHIEFCEYHPESCPLGFEYCQCKDFIEEDDIF